MRASVESPKTAHTEPSPTATAPVLDDGEATVIRLRDAFELRIDARDLAEQSVRNPHCVLARGEPGRRPVVE